MVTYSKVLVSPEPMPISLKKSFGLPFIEFDSLKNKTCSLFATIYLLFLPLMEATDKDAI